VFAAIKSYDDDVPAFAPTRASHYVDPPLPGFKFDQQTDPKESGARLLNAQRKDV
jgi:hypothetical protein